MLEELRVKHERAAKLLQAQDKDALHLGLLGNISWMLCGGDAVIVMGESVAEVIVTPEAITLLTATVEQGRFEAEQVPTGVEVVYYPWFEPEKKQALIYEIAGSERLISDSDPFWEVQDLWALRVPLLSAEMARYRAFAHESAVLVGQAMRTLTPGMNEFEIKSRLSAPLHAAGIQTPVLLVGADERLNMYRHPLPFGATFHKRAMGVVCARRHGLVVSLTRLVSVEGPSVLHEAYTKLLEIEAALLQATQHGMQVQQWFAHMVQAYAAYGFADEYTKHHQGGPCGYFARDFLACANTDKVLSQGSAYAWNPSVRGLKVEDTFLLHDGDLENITTDPVWPMRNVAGRMRPDVLQVG